jgi:xanthine dehydrogenase accessory factor
MNETQEVLKALTRRAKEGRPAALATIFEVNGSTYRRPGARLLVSDDDELVGNLSGGCLEGEVQDVARDVMRSGEPRVVHYDLTADDEVVWGWGLGCNGAIGVFVEPADNSYAVAEALKTAVEREQPVVLATVLETEMEDVRPGARLLVVGERIQEGTIGSRDVDGVVAEAAREALAAGESQTRRVEGLRVFFEVIEPPLRLLVCGAGHDAIPLVRMAASLGWRVVVVDDREGMLSHERFPDATAFVRCSPDEVTEAAEVDGRTYVVVMSHNFLRDKDYLKSLLRAPAAYVGMLGPKARLQRLLDILRSDGVEIPEDLTRVHGPAGLDIGGEGPDEIAAAIVGEVLAVSCGRGGGFLRERSGPIHDRRAAKV